MKKILPLICLIIPVLSMAQNTLSTGLIAHYKFNANLADSSGNGNHGTNSGTTFVTDRNGNANGAVSFNGSSSYITVPASASLNSPNAEFSLTTWINVQDWFLWASFKFAPIVCKTQTTDATQYRVVLTDTQFDLILSGNQFVDNAGTTFSKNQWYHVAISSYNDSCYFYLNGNLVKGLAATGTFPDDSTQNLEIGRDYAGSIDYLNGYLDELRLYNRGLTAAEVYQIYNNVTTGLTSTIDERSKIRIWPNPANGMVYIDHAGNVIRNVTVMNTLGEVVYTTGNNVNVVDLSNLKNGVYMINVLQENGAASTHKIVLTN